MRLSGQLEEARRSRRPRKPAKKSPREAKEQQLLLDAIKRAGGVLEDGDESGLDGLVESTIVARVDALVNAIFDKDVERPLKVVRTSTAEDTFDAMEWPGDEDYVQYSARIDYPSQVRCVINAKISPKRFVSGLANELRWVIEPDAAARKAAADKQLLAYAGGEGLAGLLRGSLKRGYSGDLRDSKLADQVVDFVESEGYQNTSISADDPDVVEMMVSPSIEPKIEPRGTVELEPSGPWRFKATIDFFVDGEIDWED
jgi:hypothetical protein